MLGVVFEQQEVFEAAMQRHLFRLDFHLVESCQVERGFFDGAIPVGELLLKIVQGPAALRCELADVLPGHTQEAAHLPQLLLIAGLRGRDRKSTRLNSSHSQISYAVFCLKKKTHYYLYGLAVGRYYSAAALLYPDYVNIRLCPQLHDPFFFPRTIMAYVFNSVSHHTLCLM